MTITIDIDEPSELEHPMGWLRDDDLLNRVAFNHNKLADQPLIIKGDKSIDPDGLRGIWKDNPRTLEEIRKASWRI